MNNSAVTRVFIASLSTGDDSSVIKAATLRITMKVLCRSIDDIVDIELLPMADMKINDFLAHIGERLDTVESGSSLFCASVMSNDFPVLRRVSRLLRQECPDIPIVAGGPHFVARQKTARDLPSTTEQALEENVVDIANIGEGAGLRDLILGMNKGDLQLRRSNGHLYLKCLRGAVPAGMYYRKGNGKASGRGKGARPHITYGNPYALPVMYREGVGINYNLSNWCPNNCGYCNSPKFIYEMEPESYLDEISRSGSVERVAVLQANDNHPFEIRNRQRTLALLNTIIQRYSSHPRLINFFIDPSSLIEEESAELWDFLKNLPAECHQFQFGRECADGRVASVIGRNYHGKARDQQSLDREKKAIMDLAAALPESRFKVFYIITPFESPESLRRMLDEVEAIKAPGNIYTGSNLLWPLPGSRNRVRYRGQYFSFEHLPLEIIQELTLLTPFEMNFWHPEMDASPLLDLLMGTSVKLYHDPQMPNNSLFHLTMLKILAAVAFGEYHPGETVDDFVKTIPEDLQDSPSDMGPDFVEDLEAFGAEIDQGGYWKPGMQNRIELICAAKKRFWLWDDETINKYRQELETFHQFRTDFFS